MPDVFELTIEPGRADGVDLLEQRALGVDPFDDGFDDPVRVGELREVAIESTDADERGGFSREERVRFEGRGALQPFARRIGGQVEEQRRDARVREVRRRSARP